MSAEMIGKIFSVHVSVIDFLFRRIVATIHRNDECICVFCLKNKKNDHHEFLIVGISIELLYLIAMQFGNFLPIEEDELIVIIAKNI